MNRLWIGLASLTVLFALNGSASAQYYQSPPQYTSPYNSMYGYRSGLSPYLNLLRGGDPAANYFLGTIPEFQRRGNYTTLRTAIQEAETRAANAQNEVYDLSKPLESTGHPSAFGYYSSYYPGMNLYRSGGTIPAATFGGRR